MDKIKKKEKYVAMLILISVCFFLLPSSVKGADPYTIESTWYNPGTWPAAMLSSVGNLLFSISSILLGWTGKLFDISVEYSIMENSKKFYTEGIVATGWTMCRDFANLFFIFILIFIGIATILQLQSYGYKRLLLGVIIAALLINFSGVITRLVIDASNVFAMEFICKMSAEKDGKKTCEMEGIGESMMAGFKTQTIFGENKNGEVELYKPYETDKVNKWNIVLITFLGSGLLLVMIFVLFMGALLFMTRTLVLMFLIIFAPLAFIGSVIGSSQAKKWWHTLFGQSFVAPLYLFFIYLVVSHVTGTDSLFSSGNTKGNFMNLALSKNTNLDILWQFIVMAGLLIGAYVIAKQLGGASATMAIKIGQFAKGKAIGYAGRVGKGARAGARRAAGPSAEKLATSDNKYAARLRTIPLAGRAITTGAAKISAANRSAITKEKNALGKIHEKKVASAQKTLERYGAEGITPSGIAVSATLKAQNKAKIEQIKKTYENSGVDAQALKEMVAKNDLERIAQTKRLAELGDLSPGGKFTHATLLKSLEDAKRYEVDTKDVKSKQWQWAETQSEKTDAIKNITADEISKLVKKINSSKPEDAKYKDYLSKENQTQALRSFKPEHMKNIFNEGGDAARGFAKSMKGLEKEFGSISKGLKEMGNEPGASWLESTPGQRVIEVYMSDKNKKPNFSTA